MTATKKRRSNIRYTFLSTKVTDRSSSNWNSFQLEATNSCRRKIVQCRKFLQNHPKLSVSLPLIVFAIALCYCYWIVILNHGIFLPPFVQLRTNSHETVIPQVPKYDFKPPFRVVVSFTTMPHHMGMYIYWYFNFCI